jgi:flagellar biosynthesis protein FlhF
MNVKRFFGRNSREAMQKVRLAFGDNAVVLSTKPCSDGIEVLAMPPESVEAIERFDEQAPQRPPHQEAPASARLAPRQAPPAAARPAARPVAPGRPAPPSLQARVAEQDARTRLDVDAPQVQDDVGTLAMSTLSFQDYVRERMLKKRQAEMREQAMKPVPATPEAIEQRLAQREVPPLPSYAELSAAAAAAEALPSPLESAAAPVVMHEALLAGARPAARAAAPVARQEPRVEARQDTRRDARPEHRQDPRHEPRHDPRRERRVEPAAELRGLDELSDLAPLDDLPPREPALRARPASRQSAPADPDARQQSDMMNEIRAMKGLIEERFGALAFMERLQKSPKQAQLTTRLLDCGFSPALIRKLVDSLGDEVVDELAWAGEVLQRNLVTGEADAALEDQGGVYALVGSTGVGKTTSTAKLAAAFATRHGAANLGLITLDAYRLGAHEQLRAYGRILGVPVHTAHDRVALEDLLDLLSAKKMILIDTAGLAQRDTRTRELLEMLSHPSIQRLLVVNAAQQGETIEDVLVAYKAAQAKGIVLSKLDEAVKLGPALDALIRHRLKVVAVANGQRVPEDWHRLTAQALMHRALRTAGSQAWRMDVNDVNLLFSAPPSVSSAPKRPRSSSAARGAGQ